MKRSGVRERYEDDRLYCVTCKAQPNYFIEMTDWKKSLVTPEGSLIRVMDGRVEYLCPPCGGTAKWGSELNAGD